ncbi:MAG: 3'(2'),5'-bisphosphate nucleotidase CysQ [Candidatus Hydrogenedentota bacterium]
MSAAISGNGSAPYSSELAAATRAALAAGEITERYFGTDKLDTRQKAPGHPVTVADIEANDAIQAILSREFPEDGWLSEETADSTDRLAKKRVWIIDPIDGTKEFISGVPEYVVSIGLAVGPEIVAGVVFQPTRKLLYRGSKNGGATLNDQPIALAASPAARPKIFVSRSETRRGQWKPHESRFDLDPCGSIAFKICRVAAGEADGVVTIEPRSEWDIAGAGAILEAAGGMLTTHNARPIPFNSARPVTLGGVIGGSAGFIRACAEHFAAS